MSFPCHTWRKRELYFFVKFFSFITGILFIGGIIEYANIKSMEPLMKGAPTKKNSELTSTTNHTAEVLQTKKVPFKTNHIIQVGRARTATTFQFHTLCVMAFLKFPHRSIACKFNQFESKSDFLVSKTHHFRDARKFVRRKHTVFFATTSSGEVDKGFKGFDFTYVANMSFVKNLGVNMIYEYVPIFQLDKNTAKLVLSYFKHWDILRICCGDQMSTSWREKLMGISNETHQCDQYNISSVEESYMKSKLYKKMKSRGMKDFLKPALADGDLTGKYCEEYNDGVRRCNWTFNSWLKGEHFCPKN